ncbi:MAG: DUF4249 family protein [Rhodothermales bacterium]
MSLLRFASSRAASLAALMALALATGCDTTSTFEHEPEVVVEAYLLAGERLPQVRISRSTSIKEIYDFTERAISDATVRILLLAADGSTEAVYDYFILEQEPGVYRPSDVVLVESERTYRLEVVVPGEPAPVTATTIVPGDFELVAVNADTIVYQGGSQLELDVTRSVYPGRQSIYVFTTESLTPTADLLTPFYRDVAGDNEEDIGNLQVTNSPLINEGNYDINPDGTLTIRLPWIAVAFYGQNRLTASALDDNLYDFFRSQSVQQGGSTLSPGEIPNVIEHVEGGAGVFGSYARSSFVVTIVPQSAP